MGHWKSKNVSLTPRQAKFVHTCVTSGRYQSASEVVRAGLRLLEDQESTRRAAVQNARLLIEQGARDADAGRLVDGKTLMSGWKRKHAKLRTDSARLR